MNGLSDLIDYGVVGLLLILSIWAVAAALERLASHTAGSIGTGCAVK